MVDGVNGEEKGGGDSIRCGMLPETTNIACRLFPRGCNCATHWTVPAAAHALHQRNESFRRKSRIASLRSMTELVSISISLSFSLTVNPLATWKSIFDLSEGKRGFWTQDRSLRNWFLPRHSLCWMWLYMEYGIVGFVFLNIWKIMDLFVRVL